MNPFGRSTDTYHQRNNPPVTGYYSSGRGYEPPQNYMNLRSIDPNEHHTVDRSPMHPPPSYPAVDYGPRPFQGSQLRPHDRRSETNLYNYGYQTRGGHFGYNGNSQWRGRGGGFRKNEGPKIYFKKDDISSYFKQSMLQDPWESLIAKATH